MFCCSAFSTELLYLQSLLSGHPLRYKPFGGRWTWKIRLHIWPINLVNFTWVKSPTLRRRVRFILPSFRIAVIYLKSKRTGYYYKPLFLECREFNILQQHLTVYWASVFVVCFPNIWQFDSPGDSLSSEHEGREGGLEWQCSLLYVWSVRIDHLTCGSLSETSLLEFFFRWWQDLRMVKVWRSYLLSWVW